jgi:hypothetical protein
MTQLSPRQLADHGATAGWHSQTLVTAVAIALAESGGKTDAHAVNAREDSRGLWQINVRAHPEYASANLYDPAVNAQAAHAIYAKSGWGPWSTHSGLFPSYLLWVPTAEIGVAGSEVEKLSKDAGNAAQQIPGVSQATAVADSAQQALGFMQKAGQWMGDRENWARIEMTVIGGVLIIAGLSIVAWPVAKPAVDTAGKLIP